MVGKGMVVASLAATLAAGCADGGGTISCTVSQDDGALGVLRICLEAPANTLSQGCTPAGSTGDGGVGVSVAEGPCSRVGAVGGCRISSGGVSETIWYYQDGTDAGNGPMSSDIRALCAEGGATFVAP